MAAVTQDLQTRLREFLAREEGGLYARYLATLPAAASQDADGAGEAIEAFRQIVMSSTSAAPQTQAPAAGSPAGGASAAEAVGGLAQQLEQVQLAAWLRSPTRSGQPFGSVTDDPFVRGAARLLAIVQTVEYLADLRNRKELFELNHGNMVDLAFMASRLYYAGVYYHWRQKRGFILREIHQGAFQLRDRLEKGLGVPKRIFVVEEKAFDNDLHERMDLEAPKSPNVLPLSFGMHKGPPDNQKRPAQVREFDATLVSEELRP